MDILVQIELYLIFHACLRFFPIIPGQSNPYYHSKRTKRHKFQIFLKELSMFCELYCLITNISLYTIHELPSRLRRLLRRHLHFQSHPRYAPGQTRGHALRALDTR